MDIDQEQQRIDRFVAEGNFHAALNITLSALNACRHDGDQAGVDRCLDIIMAITATLACEYGSEEYLGPT